MENDNSMEILLHAGECPHNYQCRALDCMECMEIYMDKGGAEDGK